MCGRSQERGKVYQIFMELPISCTSYILDDYEYMGVEEELSYWDIACGE